jgi:acyl carrier protein
MSGFTHPLQETSSMSIRSTIIDQIRLVAEQHQKSLAPLTDDLDLLDSGLDSLSIAILVANLEDELDLDPFGSGDEVAIPVTLGDFIDLYEHAAV